MRRGSKPKVSDDEFVAWIRAYWAAHRHGPTVREVAGGLELASTSPAHARLTRLQREGRVTWEPYLARTLRAIW